MTASPQIRPVAWLPVSDDPYRPYEADEHLVRDWLTAQRRESGMPITVILETLRDEVPPGYLPQGGQPARVYSTRTCPTRTQDGSPILAFFSGLEAFTKAWALDRTAPFCAIEVTHLPLAGWARELQAVDLPTGGVTPDTRDPALVGRLDFLLSSGNNAWTRGFGADQATAILRQLASAGTLSRDDILGYMLAHYKGKDAVTALEKLIGKVSSA